MNQGDVRVCEGCALMPPKMYGRKIPFVAVWLALGASVVTDWKGRSDTVAVMVNHDRDEIELSTDEYEVALSIAKKLDRLMGRERVVSLHEMMWLCYQASEELDRMGSSRSGLKGIAMLKDRSGAGYWRMVFPARHMDKSGIYVDVTAAGAEYEKMVEYDTVMVQRIHDWESFHMLRRLKDEGKRIVYDIDDDIFNIDRENPASKLIGRDEQLAAVACMRIADEITVSTKTLAGVVRDVTEGREAVVVPNAIDMSDGWVPTPFAGSPDGIKRIFWQGGDTHGKDWMECADAVDAVMGERQDVRVVILGFLPPVVVSMLSRDSWKDRVEFLEFRSPETYFEMMKHVRAEVGLAPLKDSKFNRSKSCLKFLEYSAMGMPTVASDVGPYSEVVENGVDGFLVRDAQGWFEAITACLDGKRERLAMLEKARRKVLDGFDIRKVASEWKRVLVGG